MHMFFRLFADVRASIEHGTFDADYAAYLHSSAHAPPLSAAPASTNVNVQA